MAGAVWGDIVSGTQLTGVSGTEEFFDQAPTLKPGEAAVVQIANIFVGSPTDDLLIAVYGSLDGVSYDVEPLIEFRIENDNSPSGRSFSVSSEDAYQFRVGARSSGSTDTIPTIDMSYRLDNVNLDDGA